jgi:membrane protein YqaA with SNARE-associated domain
MLKYFASWWGLVLLAAFDSSVLFFLPFGVDALVVYLSARWRDFFWLVPILATAGSLAGAAVTFWIGAKAGETGLERFVHKGQLERIRRKVRKRGAIALAIPALMPPPFPLTPFILVCGALGVSRRRFFATLGVVRLVRFGVETTLARIYGEGILRALESDGFRLVIIAFAVVAIAGTAASGVVLWRNSKRMRQPRPA